MGKITDGVRTIASKLRWPKRLHWPNGNTAKIEQKQVDRGEGEGGPCTTTTPQRNNG